MSPQVLNKRDYNGWAGVPPDAVYVGRPSRWGNPFVIGPDGDRVQVVRRYHQWLTGNADLMDALGDIAGKNLVCWCAPKPCHADVLLKLANRGVA